MKRTVQLACILTTVGCIEPIPETPPGQGPDAAVPIDPCAPVPSTAGGPQLDIIAISTEPYVNLEPNEPHPQRFNQWVTLATDVALSYVAASWSVRVGVVIPDYCVPTWVQFAGELADAVAAVELAARSFPATPANQGLQEAHDFAEHAGPEAVSILVMSSPMPDRSWISFEDAVAGLDRYTLAAIGGDGIRVSESEVRADEKDRVYAVARAAARARAVPAVADYTADWTDLLGFLTEVAAVYPDHDRDTARHPRTPSGTR